MSEFAFYNHVSGKHSLASRTLIPFQRTLRRILRPMFDRLHEILQTLSHRQHQQGEALASLHGRSHGLEERYLSLMNSHRALVQDHLAATRRLEQLEDMIIQMASGPSANEDRAVILRLHGSKTDESTRYSKAS